MSTPTLIILIDGAALFAAKTVLQAHSMCGRLRLAAIGAAGGRGVFPDAELLDVLWPDVVLPD
eukprot:7979166-Lingulodinium_polyedra.AAC.1